MAFAILGFFTLSVGAEGFAATMADTAMGADSTVEPDVVGGLGMNLRLGAASAVAAVDTADVDAGSVALEGRRRGSVLLVSAL